MKTMTLNCFGITVTVGKNSDPTAEICGTIKSNLHNEIHDSNLVNEVDAIGNAAADTMESFILSLACSGFDIESPAFQKSIKETVDAIVNHFD